MVAPRDATVETTEDSAPVAVAAPAPPPAAPLPYDPAAGRTVSVRGFRLLVVLTLVNTVLLASMVLGPQLFPFARQQFQAWKDGRAQKKVLVAQLAAQQQCQAYSQPAAKVAYEEDPDGAMKLINADPRGYETAVPMSAGAPPGWVAPVRSGWPDAFNEFLTALSPERRVQRRYDALPFLHERTNPAGDRFLVAVYLRPAISFNRQTDYSDGPAKVAFQVRKDRVLSGGWWPILPGGPSAIPRTKARTTELRLWLGDERDPAVALVDPNIPLDKPPPIDYGRRLRLYAGQCDPADASHFTIAYDLDGRPGTIDGWLRNDGLELKPREGSRMYEPNTGEVWKLSHGP